MLRITMEMKLCRNDSLPLPVAVSEEEVFPEQQHFEEDWSPGVPREYPDPTQIKEEQEEQEELRTSQKEEQLRGLGADCIEFRFPTSREKGQSDQGEPLWSLTPPQTQAVENQEGDPEPVDIRSFATVSHPKGFDIPFAYSDHQDNASSSAVSRNPVGRGSSTPLDPGPSVDYNPSLDPAPSTDPSQSAGEHCLKPNTVPRKTHRCLDCGETFGEPLNADLQRHGSQAKRSPGEFHVCKKRYVSTCKLKARVQLGHSGKPGTCPFCGRTFKQKAHLSRHMSIHTGKKPFSCSDCGKSFSRKETLTRHVIIHTGEKPFICGDCGKSFNRKEHLTGHRCAFH
uniref:C2H2-type domain-containing protein n=2 Tax=Esox lucius TaxID=8010 RepID=A0AAY5L3Q9_ESOLU